MDAGASGVRWLFAFRRMQGALFGGAVMVDVDTLAQPASLPLQAAAPSSASSSDTSYWHAPPLARRCLSLREALRADQIPKQRPRVREGASEQAPGAIRMPKGRR